jgi:colicin import membrane protein
LIADRAGVASAVREQIAPCWNPPIEGAGVEPVRVTLRLQLNIQGSLREEPTVIDRGNSPGFQAAVDNAVRAVKRCTPLKLPPSVHAYWEEIQLTFDTNEAPRSTK